MHDANTHEGVGDRHDWSLSGGARRGPGGSPLSRLWSPRRRGLNNPGSRRSALLRSTADSSLSLSLSLCSQSSDAKNGSDTDLLAGSDHALRRGFSAARRRPATAVAPFACACVSNSLGRAPHNPGSASEEAPSRAYFPRAGAVGPSAAVPTPNPGPRRAPSSSRLTGVCSSVICPSPTGLWRSRRLRRVLPHAPVVVPVGRRGLSRVAAAPLYLCPLVLVGGC
jgi:hypothetical protein